MKKKKKALNAVFILLGILAAFPIAVMTIEYRERLRAERSIENVFDEMVVNKCESLRQAQNIEIVSESDPGYIKMKYSFVSDDISSDLFKYFGNVLKLSMDAAFYMRFYILDEARDYKGTMVFAYNECLHKLFIYQEEEEKGHISPADLEAYRDYLLHDVIIRGWIEYGDSRYTMDDPGEIEIVDYLLPYEYCGETGIRADRETVNDRKGYMGSFEGEESYVIWLENEELLCVQQVIEYDRKFRGGVLKSIPEKLRENVNNMDTGGTRFIVQKKDDGLICALSDIVDVDDEFIEWMKSSGKAEGNLQKIPENREEGCRNTQIMLQNCPEERIKEALEQCEFYIEPGYLHIRFPYWDYKAEDSGWVKNGNSLWKGWLTMETGDIDKFLKVEKW